MSRKKYYLVLDVETAEDVDTNPLPYDLGYAICDKRGNIELQRSFVIADIFLDLKTSMQSAYYHEKIPKYWDDIKAGKRTLTTFWKVWDTVRQDIKDYKIDTVCAYNAGFDRKALNNLIRYCTKSKYRWFFPYGIEFNCIWHMACQVLMARPTYINFCLKNELYSKSNNIMTSAECAYKYITWQTDFEESHTGLEDVKIEIEIMKYCYRQKKKMDKGINRLCWRIPQIKRKEIDSKNKQK